MFDDVLARLEIDLWRDDLRSEGWRLCREAHDAALERARTRIEALSDRDLFLPRSEAWKDIQSRLRSDINMLIERLGRRFESSWRESFRRIEAVADEDGGAGYEAAALYLGGTAAGLGSVGLAMGAGTLATTTVASTGFLGLGFFAAAPVTIISWPVFAAVGGAAAVTAIASPHVRRLAKRKQRERLVAKVEAALGRHMTDRAAEISALAKFNELVDRIARERKGALDV